MFPAFAPRRGVAVLALVAALSAGRSAAALAAPAEYLPVGDPLEAELRVLDLYAPSPAAGRIELPSLHSRPLRLFELMGTVPPARVAGARGVTVARIERALGRDATAAFASDDAPRSTPRLLQRSWPGEQRLELSAGLEGMAAWTDDESEDRTRLADGSGVHLRATFQSDRWLGHAHVWLGELRDVTAFSDALVADTDIAASTEDSWLSYQGGAAWSLQLGRSRWHWGPGEEGSLLLSKTSAPLSGMMLHARIEPLRADASIFSATTSPGRGEQLAAHRLEWQPLGGVRLGIAEAARYRAGGWQGLYVSGLVPYSIVQRLLDQDDRDSAGTARNNVMISADLSVRIADGSRAYGELLVDDLHARYAGVPNKLAYQLGWDGTGDVHGTRLTWNAEYTRLSRFVYTSYFGRVFSAQGRPIGFPTGPDAERLRLRASWDPDADWQLTAIAARTRTGEGGIAAAFVPGGPVPEVFSFAGVPETSRSLEGGVRWWPASGVDCSLLAGREWRENADHVAGSTRAAWRAVLSLRLVR
ncbi:MAG: hypothetical protein IT347_14670 [Candidatus Eisenbacteria bacterium]|nr:hypothetical protein [Candidatus Eisenbacteria bacterium]